MTAYAYLLKPQPAGQTVQLGWKKLMGMTSDLGGPVNSDGE
jgi:hypothetical protein